MVHIRTELLLLLLLLLNKLGLTAARTELLIELVRTRLPYLLLLLLLLLPELACVRLAKLLLLLLDRLLLANLARLDRTELGGWGSHPRTELAPCLSRA